MAEKSRRKAKQPTGGGGSGGRAGATVGISEELSGEQELGQLLSNLRTESMPSCWICLEEGADNDGGYQYAIAPAVAMQRDLLIYPV